MNIEEVTLNDIVMTFDESNPNWYPDVEANILFVRGVLNHAHEVLIRRNHLFVNELFDLFGFPRTRAGVVLGWISDSGQIAEFLTLNHTNKIVIRITPEDLIWNKI